MFYTFTSLWFLVKIDIWSLANQRLKTRDCSKTLNHYSLWFSLVFSGSLVFSLAPPVMEFFQSGDDSRFWPSKGGGRPLPPPVLTYALSDIVEFYSLCSKNFYCNMRCFRLTCLSSLYICMYFSANYVSGYRGLSRLCSKLDSFIIHLFS